MMRELWKHPAVAGAHVVSNTRDYPGDRTFNVATCQCGWTHRIDIKTHGARDAQDTAIERHWLDVIALAQDGPS